MQLEFRGIELLTTTNCWRQNFGHFVFSAMPQEDVLSFLRRRLELFRTELTFKVPTIEMCRSDVVSCGPSRTEFLLTNDAKLFPSLASSANKLPNLRVELIRRKI